MNTRRRLIFAAVLGLVLVLSGCVSMTVKPFGAATIEDRVAEDAYIALYMNHMIGLQEDLKLFQPKGAYPGPCNAGGNRQDCLDADARSIVSLRAMLAALQGATVPPRFVEADRLLGDGLTKNIRGLELRNEAIQFEDQSRWTQHAEVLKESQVAWLAGYAAFPEDHRPAMSP